MPKTEPSVYVIAEAGVNHNGRLDWACALVHAAAEAGADAVKFQTFSAEQLIVPETPKAPYQAQTTGSEESQFEMLKSLELSPESHRKVQAECKKVGIEFLSSPFDEEAADFLDELGVTRFKLASGEVTNLPLLQHVARKGKPILLSTGMSDLKEVAVAVQAITTISNQPLTLLHCVSCYPAAFADINLRAMQTLRETFHLPVGYSDHTLGALASLTAVAAGAFVIEKHLTLDKNAPGPDHRASMDPSEFRALCADIRNVEELLGSPEKCAAASELPNRAVIRRSIVARTDLENGTVLTRDHLIMKRPANGISPIELDRVIGKRLLRPLKKNETLDWKAIG